MTVGDVAKSDAPCYTRLAEEPSKVAPSSLKPMAKKRGVISPKNLIAQKDSK